MTLFEWDTWIRLPRWVRVGIMVLALYPAFTCYAFRLHNELWQGVVEEWRMKRDH